MINPDAAHAARGAAELDLEFYLRDLVGGKSAQEGNILPSPAPPLPPPRRLDSDFCFWFHRQSVTLLAELVKGTTAADVQARVDAYRSNPAVRRAFATGVIDEAEINASNANSQYAFDLTSYAIWRTATDLLPSDYRARDRYLRNLGRAILGYASDQGIVSVTAATTEGARECQSLVDLNKSTIALLQWFKNTLALCSDYRIVSDAAAETTSTSKKAATAATDLFDDLDDEDLSAGASINPLVTIVESATLRASLQLNGEQSRFVPDWLGPTMAALWECQRRKVSWEAFFVDPVYRPNPKDYFPTEQLYQFTIASSSS